MAPNNGLANAKPKVKQANQNGRTTVLKAGTVEDRGMGTNINSREVISEQIQQFLRGEGRLSTKAEVRGFFTVWTFVTRLPGPTWIDHHPGYLMRGMAYFPLAGALIGTFVSVFFDVTHVTMGLPLVIASVVSEASVLWIGGCFHEDGLADSADGVGGGWSRDQILKIMTDTRLGTYGCAVLLLYVIAKVELLATLGKSVWDLGVCEGAGPAIIVTQTLARLTAPILIKTRDYVDEQGPKYKFYSFFVEAKHLVTWHRVTFAMLTSYYVAALAYGAKRAIGLIVAVFVAAHFSGRYAEYLLAGVMGDYLGATICVTEAYLLILLVLMPHIEIHNSFVHEIASVGNAFMRGNVTFEKVITELSNDEKKITLFRFVLVGILTTIWCRLVGHPPVFVRKTVAQNGETNEVQIALSKDNDTCKEKRGKKQEIISLLDILIDPKKDFKSRYDAVRLYLDSLAKPVGSLGALEDWAARLAALQRTPKPVVNKAACLIFAADHGVAKDKECGGENCSAYPQAVTRKVLEALDHNMAGASVLAAQNDVFLRVVDVGVTGERTPMNGNSDVVIESEHKLVGGTKNFCKCSAMTKEEMDKCMLTGRQEVRRCIDEMGTNVLVFGEVGIGNTTTSSALIAAITGEPIDTLCGSGASTTRDGHSPVIVALKIAIVKDAIIYHGSGMINNPVEALRSVGGAEIAAIVGGILEASERNVAVLVDGFIVTAAAMVACYMSPNVCRILFFATRSTERGQNIALQKIYNIAKEINAPTLSEPALDMNLRMGEGTGGLIATSILRGAIAILSDLATLEAVLSLETEGSVC